MRVSAGTDIGCVRPTNQDGYFCSTSPVGPFPNLFIVADGMGGHQGGDYASRYTIQIFLDYVTHNHGDKPIRVMNGAISEANRRVLEKSVENKELAGMGTTLVAAYIEDMELYVANVGDSRLYLIGDSITQVTEDHSYVAAMMRAGEITAEEARSHPERNVITRAVGVSREVKADFFEVDLKEQDRILMCSDGLCKMVDDGRLYELASSGDIDNVSDILIKEARRNGGYDNITALVIEPRS